MAKKKIVKVAKPNYEGCVVVVEWEDAWKDGGSMVSKASHQQEPAFIVKSVGFFVAQDKKGISIADSYHPNQEKFRGPFFIPAGMIRKITAL